MPLVDLSCCRPARSSRRPVFLAAAVTLTFALLATAAAAPEPSAPLEEIVVTASLRSEVAADFPASVTILPAAEIEAAGLQHFGDVLGLVPNLNWSGGTSRPRFFQVRGIGELEQYQGAPNPSVGFLLDEVDLSGVGMSATTFDVEQVEVLRGPQGTRYGANALAGLVKLKTRDARPEPELRAELSAGGEGTWSTGAVAGGALGTAGSAWRLAAQQFRSDGYVRNGFLGRDDTNGRDETTLRGKLHVVLGPDWTADLTGSFVDVDNGFDAFVPDNSQRMLSDRPGRDAQRTRAVSARLRGGLGAYTLSSVTAYARSDAEYSFDGDWGNDAYWGEFAPYDYYSRFDRERSTLSQDLRLAGQAGTSVDWVAGVYALRLEEDATQRDWFADELLREPLASDYAATSLAAYGEAEWSWRDDLSLTAGLRVERRQARYDDSDGTRFHPTDTMLGGQLSLEGSLAAEARWYVTLARGYKAGGFNIGAAVPDERRQFEPEYAWNLEAGLRRASADARWQGEVAVFHMWREEQQVATSFQTDPGDPLTYVFYTDNAARGRNYGLEASGTWRAMERLTLGASLGLLQTEYLGYAYGERDLDGRAQAHAPEWQYSLSAQWGGDTGWMARADLTGSDAFYFDASHDQRSSAYALLNLKAGYAGPRWAAYAWARNVTDEEYAVRGFYFGLEPPDYADRLYVQRGDGRLLGVTLQWRW
jgi:iron complex outermembrane recepter protein